MKLYKLTNELGQTLGKTQWGEGVSYTATGLLGQPLCTDGWIHAYESPEIAVLMNPWHGQFKNPRLWEAEGVIGLREGQFKCGCRTLTTIREIPLPVFTYEQLVRFVIHCAAQVWGERSWRAWAIRWLDGTDRSKDYDTYIPSSNRSIMKAIYACNAAARSYCYIGNSTQAAQTARYAFRAFSGNANLLDAIAFAKGSSNELPEVIALW